MSLPPVLVSAHWCLRKRRQRGPDKPVFRSTATVWCHCQADTLRFQRRAKTRLTPSPLRSSPCLLQLPAPHSPGHRCLKNQVRLVEGNRSLCAFFLLSSVKSIETLSKVNWPKQKQSKVNWPFVTSRHFPKLSTAKPPPSIWSKLWSKTTASCTFWHFLGQAVVSLPLSSESEKHFVALRVKSPRYGTGVQDREQDVEYELSSWLLTWEPKIMSILWVSFFSSVKQG